MVSIMTQPVVKRAAWLLLGIVLASGFGLGLRGARAGEPPAQVWKEQAVYVAETHAGNGSGPGIHDLAFALDGKTLLARSGDGSFKLWDVATRKEAPPITLKEDAPRWAVSPDGKTLAAAGLYSIVLWDLAAGKELRTIRQPPEAVRIGGGRSIQSLAVSPDGKTYAVGLECGSLARKNLAGEIELRNLSGEGEPLVLKGHSAGVTALDFSPDGKTLASTGNDRTLRLWDVAAGKELKSFALDTAGFLVRFSPDGKTLAVNSHGYTAARRSDFALQLWDVPSGKSRVLFHSTETKSGQPGGVAFSPDGKTVAAVIVTWSGPANVGIATGALSGRVTGHVRLWDVEAGKEVATLKGSKEDTSTVAFGPDGKTLALGSQAGNTVVIWQRLE
jgi:WD40 repeat protein